MANSIILKKSSVGAKVPLVTDLVYGETALNYADGKLYYKTSSNTIDYLPSATATATLTNKTLTAPIINYIDFTGAAATLAAGRLWYDSTTGGWQMGMGNGNITQNVGEEIFVRGKASAAISGNSILQAIYQTGTVGGSGVVTFAPTITGITNGDSIIGVATEDIALNGFGRVTSIGIVHGIDTTGSTYGETWADNDDIWYNPITGGLTKTKPTAPRIKVRLGTIIKAGTGGSGSFQVEISHGSTLGGTDSNVEITSVADNNVLKYVAANSRWENSNSISLSSVAATTMTTTTQPANTSTTDVATTAFAVTEALNKAVAMAIALG